MASVRCIFLEATEFAEESLRRWSEDRTCPGRYGYHNASTVIGTCAYPVSDLDGESKLDFPKEDPRWPVKCDMCNYMFIPSDPHQHNKVRLYSRDDHAALKTTLSNAPVGSMWYANWYPWKGPDGQCLVVKTPAGDWIVDAPAWEEGKQGTTPWTRTGTPPNVSASPSIHFPGEYHGWLINGTLTDV